MSGLLGARVFVEHVDRMSNKMASLADEMSRRVFGQIAKEGEGPSAS